MSFHFQTPKGENILEKSVEKFYQFETPSGDENYNKNDNKNVNKNDNKIEENKIKKKLLLILTQ